LGIAPDIIPPLRL